MNICIDKKITLSGLSPEFRKILIEKFTITNPKWSENNRMGRWNRDTPKTLEFFNESNGDFELPRGYARQLILLCRKMNEDYHIDDRRCALPETEFNFKGKLKPFQQSAVKSMLSKEFGTLNAPTGSGKTVMALYIIARRKQPALIVVHTKALAQQWIKRISDFLGIPDNEIGLIGGGKKKTGKLITVALVQSLYKHGREISSQIGHVVVDECHRTPSRTFTEAVTHFSSKYILGLSATLYRRDNLSRLIFWYLGDTHHQVDSSELIRRGDILKADIIWRETSFSPFYDPINDYSKMLSELCTDEERNILISDDISRESLNNSGVSIVLSDRKKHCEELVRLLKTRHDIKADMLTGDTTSNDRQQLIENLDNGKVKILVATGQLVGEGFDCKELTSLFLATPIRFSGRVIQYLGRVLRSAPGKNKAKVFDYVDVKVDTLANAANSRQRVYNSLN